jgi:hypothetical protein
MNDEQFKKLEELLIMINNKMVDIMVNQENLYGLLNARLK